MSRSEGWELVPRNVAYGVSSLGRVVRLLAGPGTWPGRVKKPTINHYGYLVVNLPTYGRAKVYLVHRIVCIAFHGPPPSPLHEAGHRDGDKLNCCKDNLRWVLPVENTADKYAHGTVLVGDRHQNTKVSDADLPALRALDWRQRDIAALYGISQSQVSRIKSGDRGTRTGGTRVSV